MKAALAIAGVVVLAILVVVGGYQLGWWLKKDITDRQVGIDNRQKGTQTAWHDEAIDLMNQADLLPEGAPQAANLRKQACQLIARLSDPYLDDIIIEFQTLECA